MIKLALLPAAVQALAPAQGKKLVGMPEFSNSFIAVIRCPRNHYDWKDDAFRSRARNRLDLARVNRFEHDLADALAASAAGCGAVYSEIQKGKQ